MSYLPAASLHAFPVHGDTCCNKLMRMGEEIDCDGGTAGDDGERFRMRPGGSEREAVLR
jgi:hypothetical protein